MSQTDPLIRTKLRMPPVRPDLVSRPRLLTRIAEGLRLPLTLVIAPAGFGKTTLTASCAAGCGMPVAWLSLDKDDNQPGRFLTYLIAALQGVDQHIGGEAAQLMAGIQQASPEAVLTSLINDLDIAGGEAVLVLDDYQLINSQAVYEEVVFLLDHQPAALHLIIAARSDPPLPLARLRARGQLVELRAADLRFTALEAAQFLNDVMGFHLDEESVAVLEERTEGWIAGLQMAALSMRGREDVEGFIREFAGTNRFIMDFMLEEVFAREPEAVQNFLLQTAFLTRLTGPLCDAVTGASGGQEMLETLERRNLFILPVDDERRWYRYHHLFADLLQARLYKRGADHVAQLSIRAADWCEQDGQVNEAVGYALAAQDFERAADLIERYGAARWAEGDPSIVRMADNLPPDKITTRHKINFYYVWLLIIEGRIDKAIPLMNDIARHLEAAGSDSDQRWRRMLITLALAFLGQRTSDNERLTLPDYNQLDEIPGEEAVLRDVAEILLGMTLSRRKENERAAEVSLKCIRRKKSYEKSLTIPTLVPVLSRIYLELGRLNDAAALCHEFLDPIKEKDAWLIYSAGSTDIALGEVLYEWNRLEEAERQIREGILADEPWVDIMSDAFGRIALIRVLTAKGDYAGAMEAVEKFEAKMLGYVSRPFEFEEDLRTLRTRVQLACGDPQSASAWADQIQQSEEYRLHPGRYRLTLGRIRLAQGRPADVEKLLAETPASAEAGNPISQQIESDLLLAAAAAQQNRLAEAFELVEASLALAEPEGFIRIFIDVGDPARELLAAYLRASDAPAHEDFARKVLEAFSAEKGARLTAQPGELAEPLSEREIEVLQLMALGKTNPEIAGQLIVSPGTVKAHTANIYRKLDAANRTDAVGRARQLGILP